MFEDILIYIIQIFEYFYLSPDSNVNRDTVATAQVLLNHVTNFYAKVNNLSEFSDHEKSFENFGNNVCHIMHLRKVIFFYGAP